MTRLSPAALLAVEDAVRVVVDHDDERLPLLAPDAGDLYVWTRDYGSHGAVDLVVPPGTAEDWDIDSTDLHDGGKHVAVELWTRQEGRSDLTLKLRLNCDKHGRWQPPIVDLHVL
jgi:hypothetical protein